MRFRYLLDDRTVAEKFGYHPPTVDVEATTRSPFADLDQRGLAVMFGRRRVDSDTPETQVRLIGDLEKRGLPAGGCNETAKKVLLDSADHPVDGDDVVLDQLDDRAYVSMKTDAIVQQGFSAWSTCMAERSYTYPTPSAANDDPRWWKSDVPSKLEIKIAVADVDCKTEVHLVDLQFEVERRHDEIIIRDNHRSLDEIEKLGERRLAVAQKLLTPDRP